MNLSNQTHAIMTRPEPFNDYLQEFAEYIDARPKTIETYSRALKQFFAYLLEHTITQPARADILNYRAHLSATCKPATVNAYLIAVKRFFQWTNAQGIYENIAANVKGPKIGKKTHKKDALTSRQTKDVMKHMNADTIAEKRDYAIFALMVTTGLRTIEVSRADIEDMRTAGDETVLYIQGKGHDEKSEYVKIAEPVEKAIRAYLTARGSSPAEPLFTSTSNNSKGARMTTRSISGIIKQALVNAGYDSDRMTAHSLRHTAATLNLLNGATLEETQQLLRHADINTTLIYAHHISRSQNRSEQRIAAAIF